MHLNRRHILYVEDHEDTREMVRLVLEQHNYQVTVCPSVESGLKLASEEHFDLLLLDSWFPDGSGLDLCKRIREFDRNTPIIFYSAAAFEVDREIALRSGAQAYVAKPAHLGDLCDLISTFIDSASSPAD